VLFFLWYSRIWILSSTLLLSSYVLSRILVKTSFSFYSKVSVYFFSSFVSSFTYSTIISSASFLFLATCNFVTSVLARNWTSYVTLIFSMYNNFVSIWDSTNYTSAKSMSGVWAMDSSTCSMCVVTWKLKLSCATIWMVSSSFYMLLSSAFVVWGINYVAFSYLFVACILSMTCFISYNTFIILPLCFSTSLNSFTSWSCTLSTTISTSSSVIFYSEIWLCDVAFLCSPPVCIIGRLGGPVSCGVANDEVSCIILSPIPCSSFVGEFSFFLVYASLFGVLHSFAPLSFD
jgi:hypothetical protein